MPQLDGTGPMGEGSQSGRKHGRCRKDQPGENTQLAERGKGRGFRIRFHANEDDVFEHQNRKFGRGRGNDQRRGMGRLHKGI